MVTHGVRMVTQGADRVTVSEGDGDMTRAMRLIVIVAAFTAIGGGITLMQPERPAEAAAPYYGTTSREGSIYRLYRGYFLREPDRSGFNHWMITSLQGRSLQQISELFASSSEFQNRYGKLDNTGFVNLVFKNVMDRNPDPGGRDYWVGKAHAGMARGTVMMQFSDSSEYKRKTNLGVPPGYRAGTNAVALLAVLTVKAEPSRVGYDRNLFKHWDDEDRNGCDTRCEVLRSERRGDGTWFSLWDGYTAASADEVQIDHVVALAEAWDSGANTWTPTQRDQFADWQVNLTAVTEASNSRKSDKDAATWFPSRAESNCVFAEITVTTKHHWGLSVDQPEKTALGNMLKSCTAGTSNPPASSVTTTRPPTTTTTRPPTGCRSSGLYLAKNGACVSDYEDSTGDVDCGQLPKAMKPVAVLTGNDPYRLDSDHDGRGCESG